MASTLVLAVVFLFDVIAFGLAVAAEQRRSTCFPLLRKALWSSEKEREKAIEEACEQLKILENELKDKRFFGGERLEVADIVGTFVGYWVEVIQEVAGMEITTREKFPILFKWSDDRLRCSVINENLPPRDELVAAFKAHLQVIIELF